MLKKIILALFLCILTIAISFPVNASLTQVEVEDSGGTFSGTWTKEKGILTSSMGLSLGDPVYVDKIRQVYAMSSPDSVIGIISPITYTIDNRKYI